MYDAFMMTRSVVFLCLILLLGGCFGGNRGLPPAIHHGQQAGAGSAGAHNVVRGDTLYSISNRYQVTMQDLVMVNRLRAPYNLSQGQRLKLPPPREYHVQTGDTLYGVSRLFGTSSTEVVRLNRLQSPYALRAGQVLRLPSIARKTKHMTARVARVQKPQTAHASSMNAAHTNVVPNTKPVVVKNGVPLPSNKPVSVAKNKSIKVSKVRTATPKRAASRFLRPVRGKIISNYGSKSNGLHNDGINIAAPRGTPVKVAENGVVVYAGSALKGSGNLVLVRHADRWVTAYGHLDSYSVRTGKTLKRGTVLGKVGSTGSVSTAQLHFEVRRGTSAVNPVRYLE